MAIYETHPLLNALALAFIANQGHEEEFREFIRVDRAKLGGWMLEEFDRFISKLRRYQEDNECPMVLLQPQEGCNDEEE